jgi:hypothetical protein
MESSVRFREKVQEGSAPDNQLLRENGCGYSLKVKLAFKATKGLCEDPTWTTTIQSLLKKSRNPSGRL